jgi:hypothetical protein
MAISRVENTRTPAAGVFERGAFQVDRVAVAGFVDDAVGFLAGCLFPVVRDGVGVFCRAAQFRGQLCRICRATARDKRYGVVSGCRMKTTPFAVVWVLDGEFVVPRRTA